MEAVRYGNGSCRRGRAPRHLRRSAGDRQRGPDSHQNFDARAQDVEAAAEAAGVKKIYWFDPNLSGGGIYNVANPTIPGTVAGTKVGTVAEPNLDIRNPSQLGETPSTVLTPT